MKYCTTTTTEHHISQTHSSSLCDLDSLVKKEGSTESEDIFNASIVIDMDAVEISLASSEKRNQVSTMDCSFAINNGITKNMLLVEFRFNYKNLQNLNRNKLIDKVKGSSHILGQTPNIKDEMIFVFEKSLTAQARSRIFRMIPEVPSTYTVMDIYKLKELYF